MCHLANILGRQIIYLYLECKHHDEDLVLKAVKRTLTDCDSTSPTDQVVIKWQKNFPGSQDEVRGEDFGLNTFDWQWIEEYPQVKAAILAARDWAWQARSDKEHDKNDNCSRVNNILVHMGDVVPD